MHARLHQRHVTAVGAADYADAAGVEPRVIGQALQPGHVIQPVGAAPVTVDALGVVQAVPGAAPHVGHEDGQSFQGEELDERHREPGEIGPLLALGTAVNVDHKRPWALVTQLRRGQIEPRGDVQPVVRGEAGILAAGQQVLRDAEHAVAGAGR